VRLGLSQPTDEDGNVIPPERRPGPSMGMTESFGMHSIDKRTLVLPEGKRGTWGRTFAGIERRIVDPDTREVLPPGVEGELQIRGFSLMLGYYKREREETFEPDGFFSTGDLAVIDEDDFIYLRGRLGEMIKTSGANVAPREVEDYLHGIEGVREAIVFGVPDEVKGETICAVVIPSDGQAPDPEALRAQMRDDMSAYKVPQTILVVEQDDVPRTDSGKPKKNQLREKILAAT